jgi:hypothetical protein
MTSSEHKFLYLREGVELDVSGPEQGKVTCFFEQTVLDLGIQEGRYVLAWFSRGKIPVPAESFV